jgi:hypothetical protein
METFIVGIFAAIIVGAPPLSVMSSMSTIAVERSVSGGLPRPEAPTVSERLSVYDPKEPCRGHRKLRYQVYGFLRYRVLASS